MSPQILVSCATAGLYCLLSIESLNHGLLCVQDLSMLRRILQAYLQLRLQAVKVRYSLYCSFFRREDWALALARLWSAAGGLTSSPPLFVFVDCTAMTALPFFMVHKTGATASTGHLVVLIEDAYRFFMPCCKRLPLPVSAS